MVRTQPFFMPSWLSLYTVQLLFFLAVIVPAASQSCSASSPCATGCCSKFGFCGFGLDYCDKSVCVANCDRTQSLACDANKPCKVGCCSKFGFCGLGPNYCEKSICVNNCDRKADCDPGNYGSAFVKHEKCPLNVCCSKYGFCGLTEEFCGAKQVKRPACPQTGSLKRVVGYYEGWASNRACNVVYPELIPQGVYTHINFAFATIDPKTFEVRPAKTQDLDMYSRVTDMKLRDPELRVYIAIGGWDFNDPGPTATTFSDIASSDTNQKAFIESLISFMATYGFDGVDLDWEYPEAPDRSGKGIDYVNLPKFVTNLKQALKATGGRSGLSITIPASYWYLQHFDVIKLAEQVDWFNMMTYDLHGTWDQGNKWTGPYLNSHTNLTEITDALDLLWRNHIQPNKVTLGIAFYGRGFTAATPSCLAPGCTYSSGSTAQPCSNQVGVVLNSEIVDIIDRTGAAPTLDKSAAVKVLTYDYNQWVTYDDEQTLQMKADFARSQCLGGVMVWAISHDTRDGRFSKALGKASGREFKALKRNTAGSFVENKGQCLWTGCGEECPDKYVAIQRTDGNAHPGDMMADKTACEGKDVHRLCCPASSAAQTSCGWYGFESNRRCSGNNGCPTGSVEVGSTADRCQKNTWETACCTTSGGSSVALYNKCAWSDAPDCTPLGQQPSCLSGSRNEVLGQSGTGSGATFCNHVTNGFIALPITRDICCDTHDQNMRFNDCQWFSDLGKSSSFDPYFCRSSCPAGSVRIAMDTNLQTTLGQCKRGGRALCCSPTLQDENESNGFDYDEETGRALEDFFDNNGRICADPQIDGPGLHRRDSPVMGANMTRETSSNLLPRAIRQVPLWYRETLAVVQQMLVNPNPDAGMARAYNAAMRDHHYDHLVFPECGYWFRNSSDFLPIGGFQAAGAMMCNLEEFDEIIGDNVVPCACETEDGCDPDDPDDAACEAPDDGDDTFDNPDDSLLGLNQKRDIEKRRAPYKWFFLDDKNVGHSGTTRNYGNAASGDTNYWPADHAIWSRVFEFPDPALCITLNPKIVRTKAEATKPVIEHVVELAFTSRIISAAGGGKYRGISLQSGPIDASFFDVTLMNPLINPPQMRGALPNAAERLPIKRLMWVLGSYSNSQHFVMANGGLNNKKLAIWNNADPTDKKKMADLISKIVDKRTGSLALCPLRQAISIIYYMNDPTVHNSLVDILNIQRKEWGYAQNAHHSNIDMLLAYDQIVGIQMGMMADKVQDFVHQWSPQLQEKFLSFFPEPWAIIAYAATVWYTRKVKGLQIDLSGFDGMKCGSGGTFNCIPFAPIHS